MTKLWEYDFYLCQGSLCSHLVGCWVGLLPVLNKNYWMDLHETWIEDGSRPRIDPTDFWCSSGWRDELRNFKNQVYLGGWCLWVSTIWCRFKCFIRYWTSMDWVKENCWPLAEVSTLLSSVRLLVYNDKQHHLQPLWFVMLWKYELPV